MWGGKVGSMICLWWTQPQRLWIYLLCFFFGSGCHLVIFFYKFTIAKIFGQVLDFLVSKAKWGTTFHRMWIHGIQILCFGWFLGFSRQVKSSRAPRLGWMEFHHILFCLSSILHCHTPCLRISDALVRQEMERLLKLHEEVYPNSPLPDENMCLRVKNGMGKKWEELLQEGPEALSIRFAKVRSREEFGKQLHAYFRLITNQMKQTPPDRKVQHSCNIL